MKKFFLMMTAGVLMLSCSSLSDDPVVVAKNNELVPIRLPVETRAFVGGGNEFAFNLLQKVEEETEGSFMISPLSVSMAFGLLIESAVDGPVLDEVTKVLGYGEGNREEIRAYCSALMKQLPRMDKLSNVGMANLVLTNSDFGKTNSAFGKIAVDYYDALVMNLSFGKPKVIVDEVNAWSKDKTRGMVPEAIRESDLEPMTTAVLANALYFNGAWKNRFKKSDTSKEDFTLDGGKKVKVDMMKQKEEFMSGRCKGGAMINLPYGNEAFAMTVYLPDEGVGVREMVEYLAKRDPGQFVSLGRAETEVWLPKFKLSPVRTDLKDALADMGMADAFGTVWLDLLGPEGPESLINRVFQTAAIDVDESGTEAAAVTVITGKYAASASPAGLPVFHVDRPFVFTISESSTGAILFAGVYRGE